MTRDLSVRITSCLTSYFTRRITFRLTAHITSAFALLTLTSVVQAQSSLGQGASITPYAGYLVTGDWYDGPIGTTLSTANAPIIGAQLSMPLGSGLSLTANVGYASSDVRVGLPIIGGVNVGRNSLWVYDAGLELGGLSRSRSGIAPFILGGIGGMTNDIENGLISTQSTNLMFAAGVGVDIGLSRNLALRVQAKDYFGRFDSREAVGFGSQSNLTHNWALSGGVKLIF